MPQFFDIHSHVNEEQFDEDRQEVFKRMKDASVWTIIVGNDRKSSQDVAMLTSLAGDGVFGAIGVHPVDNLDGRFDKVFFDDLVVGEKIVAVGECGLDYSRFEIIQDIPAEKVRQRKLFEAQIDFACENDLPVVIHCRESGKNLSDATEDILSILREKKEIHGKHLRGHVHFFSQTIEIARKYFDLDFSISFTGVITFARDYDEVVKLAPLDRIMAETDSPYVTPVPNRGKRNEPIFVIDVVKKIAEIRGEDYETVRVALVQNGLKLFNIKTT